MKYLGKIQHEKDLITKEYGDKYTKAILNKDEVSSTLPQKLYRETNYIQTAPHTETDITLSSNLKYYKNKSSEFDEDNVYIKDTDGSITSKQGILTIGYVPNTSLLESFLEETTQSEANIIYDIDNKRIFPINYKKSYLFKVDTISDKSSLGIIGQYQLDFENNKYTAISSEDMFKTIDPSEFTVEDDTGAHLILLYLMFYNINICDYIRAIDSYDLTEFTEIDDSGYYFVVQPFKKCAFIVKRSSEDKLKYLDTTTNTLKTLATTNFVENYVEQYLQDNLKRLIESMSLTIDGGTY